MEYSRREILTLAVLLLLAGQLSAFPNDLSDYETCHRACMPRCKHKLPKWLRWLCAYSCYLGCKDQKRPRPPASNENYSSTMKSDCVLACVESSCLRLDPEEMDVSGCVDTCSKNCTAPSP